MSFSLAPSSLVEETPFWTIAVNRNQCLLGKLILVARREVLRVDQLTNEEWSSLHVQIGRMRGALDESFSPDQINYAFLMNQDAQVHLHVVPRYRSARQWNGLVFEDPCFGQVFGTEQRVLAPPQLATLAQEIRTRLR